MYHEIHGSTIFKRQLSEGNQYFEFLVDNDKHCHDLYLNYRRLDSYDYSYNTKDMPVHGKKIKLEDIQEHPIIDSFLKADKNKYIRN